MLNLKIDKTRIAIYDAKTNKLCFEGKILSMNEFVKQHYKLERSNDRGSSANAWYECECEINNVWISTFNLPVILDKFWKYLFA